MGTDLVYYNGRAVCPSCNTRRMVATAAIDGMFEAAATLACWRERPLTGNFRGDRERQEVAETAS